MHTVIVTFYKQKNSIILFAYILSLVVTMLITHGQTCAFAHDELPNLPVYDYKLQFEGRWINWLLFPCIKQINGHVALFLNLCCFFFFAYQCARNITTTHTSLAVASAALLLPSLNQLLDWPITILPMFIICALAAQMYDRMNKLYFFLIFGILFNGVLQSGYMLLPLLFLNNSAKELLKVLAYWILGFIVGFIISQSITYIIVGDFIQLEDWRNPHYITNFSSLTENITSAFNNFNKHMLRANMWLYIILISSLLVFIIKNKSKTANYFPAIACILVIFSSYAQAIPAGINVDVRTALSLHLGILILSIVAFNKSKFQLLVLILIAGIYFSDACTILNYHNLRKKRWVDDLKALNIPPETISHVIMLSNDSDFFKHEKLLKERSFYTPYQFSAGSVIQWRTAPYSLGYKKVVLPGHRAEFIKKHNLDITKLNFKTKGALCYTIEKNILVLKLAEIN